MRLFVDECRWLSVKTGAPLGWKLELHWITASICPKWMWMAAPLAPAKSGHDSVCSPQAAEPAQWPAPIHRGWPHRVRQPTASCTARSVTGLVTRLVEAWPGNRTAEHMLPFRVKPVQARAAASATASEQRSLATAHAGRTSAASAMTISVPFRRANGSYDASVRQDGSYFCRNWPSDVGATLLAPGGTT